MAKRRKRKKKIPKSDAQKMREGSLRKAHLAEGMPWVQPTRREGNPKKVANKKACRVKISPTTE